MPADLREEEKKKQWKKRKARKGEIRERSANVLLIKAGGIARGGEGMKARRQQKRKLTAGVKALIDSLFVGSNHLW